MSDGNRKDTALGVARARFVEGLTRKAMELKGAVALLVAAPGSDRPREEMRRRLHALYASAQVFRIEPLADALKECIQRIDASRDQKRALSQDDLDALATLSSTLPTLGAVSESSRRPSAPPPASTRAPAFGAGYRSASPPGRAAETSSAPAARGAEVAPDQQWDDVVTRKGDASELLAEDTLDTDITMAGVRAPLPQAAPRGGSPNRAASVAPVRTEMRAPSQRAASQRAPGTLAAQSRAAAPSLAGTGAYGAVVSVLVFDASESQAQIRGALPVDTYEVLASASAEEALRLARSSSPDIVLAERSAIARAGSDFIARLRNDPLTDFVPIILLVPPGTAVDPIAARALGADDAIAKPVDPQALIRTIARAIGATGSTAGIQALGDLTLEQIAERIGREIRDGLAGSVESGSEVSVPLGDGSEVLAAAWSAIARVRAHVAARSGGRVRFRDLPRRGGPAVLALVDDDDAAADEAATEVSLDGRRILVVDDDPAVVWFFAGLFREAGAEVIEAADGREALAQLRAHRADVVISDILMPYIDGFALCREIQRDPALEGIPVILLSWKEDLLQRMRDLQSGASGYLRKEAGSAQILSRVRDVLRPRARLEAQLRSGGEVRGSLERIGIQNVISTVAQVTRDARLTVRDAWNLFEIDVRGGNLVHLTRTATDGSFARGDAALLQLLGATAGRFTVVASDSPVRAMFREPLDTLLERGTHRLGALVDAVSGTGLPLADRVELDEDVLAPLLGTSPEPSRAVVERLRRGESPRALIVSGEVAPQAIEAVLVDLARRGALLGVRGAAEEDRVAEAYAARTDTPGVVHTSAPKPSTPPAAKRAPIDDDDEPEVQTSEDSSTPSDPGLDWLGVEENTADIVAATHQLTREKAQVDGAPSMPSDLLDEDSLPPAEPITLTSPRPTPPTTASARPPAKAESVKPADVVAAPVAAVVTAPVSAAEARGPSATVWLVILASLGVLGFFGSRAYDDGTLHRLLGIGAPAIEEPTTEPPVASDDAGSTEAPATEAPAADAALDAETEIADAATAAAPRAPGRELTADELRFGRVEAGITDTSVTVTAAQGLLVVEIGAAGPAQVFVDDRDIGAAPLRLALPAGPHEISFRRGEDSSFRFLNIRAAHTHTVATP